MSFGMSAASAGMTARLSMDETSTTHREDVMYDASSAII